MAPLSVPRVFLAGGIAGFGYYLFMRQHWFPNPYKTQEVKNIEDRFAAGGAHPTHTPGAGTKLGSSTENESRQEGDHKGPHSEHFKGNVSDQQQDKPLWPAKFYEQQYNNPKGK